MPATPPRSKHPAWHGSSSCSSMADLAGVRRISSSLSPPLFPRRGIRAAASTTETTGKARLRHDACLFSVSPITKALDGGWVVVTQARIRTRALSISIQCPAVDGRRDLKRLEMVACEGNTCGCGLIWQILQRLQKPRLRRPFALQGDRLHFRRGGLLCHTLTTRRLAF